MSKKNYLYIVGFFKTEPVPCDGGYTVMEKQLCFDKVFLRAENENDAYALGMSTFDDKVMKKHDVAHLENNWVVPLTEWHQCPKSRRRAYVPKPKTLCEIFNVEDKK